MPGRLQIVAALCTATCWLGCGPPPPQAPKPAAQKLESGLESISAACAEAFAVGAFPGDHRADLARLEVEATSGGKDVADVYGENPDWIYQGETVRTIVDDATTRLRECKLARSAAALQRAARRG
jgi:hypothetical protein